MRFCVVAVTAALLLLLVSLTAGQSAVGTAVMPSSPQAIGNAPSQILVPAVASAQELSRREIEIPPEDPGEKKLANEAASKAKEPTSKILRGRSGFFVRLPARPKRSEIERQEHIRALRTAYSVDPSDWPAPNIDPSVDWEEIGLLPKPIRLEKDSLEAKQIELGKHLFFDARLSSSRQIACASCHDPYLAWADGRTVSFGHDRVALKRNAPTLANLDNESLYFWDGRATSLEQQAKQVLLNPEEMHSSEELILSRLAAIPEYGRTFSEAYPDKEVNLDLACAAIAQFERSIGGGRSRFDVFVRGKHDVLSDEALVGLDLFRQEARCMNCHHGPKFTDNRTHSVGLSYYGRKFQDLGRYNHTKQLADIGGFKTPSLRNISRTGPYMHNGLFPSLSGILNLYNAGMPTLSPKNLEQLEDPFFPTKTKLLKSLGLNKQDLADLLAFLKTLEEPPRRVRPPERFAEEL